MLQWRSEFEIPEDLRTAIKLHSDLTHSDVIHNSGLFGSPAYFSLEEHIMTDKEQYWRR